MKFSASSAELLKALTMVSGAVPSKSTMPILECILFEQDADTLRLTATDLEISIIQQVHVTFDGASTGRSNRIAVPAKRLLDTLRALPDLPIVFSTNDDFQITLQTDHGTYKMVGYDGADYPALPDINPNTGFEVETSLLRRAIQKTSFAVSKDALRPAMMGIYFQIKTDNGRLVATDGHRLVRLTLNNVSSESPAQFIVPEKAMALAAKVATGSSCSVSVDDSYASFDFGICRVLARLIDETYPNYEAVIPVENDKKLTVDRTAMLAAVKRVGLYSSTMTNQIRLSIASEKVEISAEDIERSSEAHETISADYDSEDMVIGFNSMYLTEVLSHINADEVVLELSSPNRAGIVTPFQQHDDEELLMLIMPVMLNTYA